MPDNVAKKKGENIGSIDCPEQDTEKELSPSVQIQACKEHRGTCFRVIDLITCLGRLDTCSRNSFDIFFKKCFSLALSSEGSV